MLQEKSLKTIQIYFFIYNRALTNKVNVVNATEKQVHGETTCKNVCSNFTCLLTQVMLLSFHIYSLHFNYSVGFLDVY